MFVLHPTARAVLLLSGLSASTVWATDPLPVSPIRPSLGVAPYLAETPAADAESSLLIQPQSTTNISVNTQSREAARNLYNGIYLASEGVAAAWSGSVSACKRGAVSSAYRAATVLRVNYYRAMAGVPGNVVLYTDAVAPNQQAALMMSANRSLSHSPPSSWLCYTADGATAAGNSNIALGMAGPSAINGYMVDNGSGNAAAGHRRWILYPKMYRVGTGDVVPGSGYSANTLWVLDSTMWGLPRPATRNAYVAWPSEGYMPRPLVPTRWSFSYPSANFSGASVSMQCNGKSVPVTQEAVANGYGDNTLVWRADLSEVSSSGDVPCNVSLANVVIGGAAQAFSYTTTLFDPSSYGADTVLPNLTGVSQLTLGTGSTYRIREVAQASNYQWRALRTLNDYADKVQGAEDGMGDLEAVPAASYAIVSTHTAASGSASYHLAQPSGAAQTLIFTPRFVPSATATLRFASRLGWATTSQTAAVQVSVNDGLSWQNVYSQAGSGGSGESGFSTRSVSLAAYADRPIRLRLRYSSNGSYYPQTTSGVGWYVDNLQLNNVLRVDSESDLRTVARRRFTFTPTQAGVYYLAARAQIFSKYPLEWGDWKQVRVVK